MTDVSSGYFDIIYASKIGPVPDVRWSNQYTKSGDTTTTSFSSSVLSPIATSCPGVIFEGWYLDSSFTTKAEPGVYYDNLNFIPGYRDGNTYTLYGKWSGINKIVYKGESLLDLSNATVTFTDLDEGVTAWDANGLPITGRSEEFIKSATWEYAGNIAPIIPR